MHGPHLPPLLLLLLLLFLPSSLGCHTSGSLAECQKAEFVPGHSLVGEGFDVVKLKTTGASVVDVHTFMAGGNKGNCTICRNRLLNKSQKLPVSVLDWRIKRRCRNHLSSKLSESSQSVQEDTSQSIGGSWKAGLEISGKGGFAFGGTHSKASRFAHQHSKQDKFSFATHEIKCQYYTFRLQLDPPLSKDFKKALLQLPSTSHSDAFRHFISVYGTHFIRLVSLGGKVHTTTAIRTCQSAMRGLKTSAIKHRLDIEASATIKGGDGSLKGGFSADRSKKLNLAKSFSDSFADRVTEVLGGDGGEDGDLLFNPDGREGYKSWLKSLKTVPGVVSYKLKSLHFLVRDNPTLKSNLKAAIRAYIISSAVALRCSSSCSVGRRGKNCACHCSAQNMVNADCCPMRPGGAQLSVTVVSGSGLWGDPAGWTDGYVKVFYGHQEFQTSVINNDNNPRWNEQFNIGVVDLTSRTWLRFQVWDQDSGWDDDLLGTRFVRPTRGQNVYKTFRLKHGSLTVKMSATCGPHLQGKRCEQYAASPDIK